jgi:hypothetical protein
MLDYIYELEIKLDARNHEVVVMNHELQTCHAQLASAKHKPLASFINISS